MNALLDDARLVELHAPALGGVFTQPDLATLMAEPHHKAFYRRLERLEQSAVLRRFTRGIYITGDFSPRALCQAVRPGSYVSFGNVLADARAIGSVPALQIDAVVVGRSRTFSAHGCTLRYFGIREDLCFGFQTQDGINIATVEKALLDTLYFHQHGARFFFDIFSDINLAAMNRTRIDVLLRKYRNPRFKTFVKDYLDERGLAKRR